MDHAAPDHCGIRVEDGSAVSAGVEKALLDAIGVGGNEVDGDFLASAELDPRLLELVGHGGRRAADAVALVYFLDRPGGYLVELQVFFESRGVKRLDIGFVPDLEVPGLDFISAVALFPMQDQRGNQIGPLIRSEE